MENQLDENQLRDKVHQHFSRRHAECSDIAFEDCMPKNKSPNQSRRMTMLLGSVAASLLAGLFFVTQLSSTSSEIQDAVNEELLSVQSTTVPQLRDAGDFPFRTIQAVEPSLGLTASLKNLPNLDLPFDELLPGTAEFVQLSLQPGDVYEWCMVEFSISEEGQVINPVVVSGEPAGVHDAEALDSISSFLFDPKIENGEAVAVQGVRYIFKYFSSSQSAVR